MTRSEAGVVFYRGPSLLTGDPIVGILTGLDGGSKNVKTGEMAQAWVLRPDLPPQEAKRQNVDDAICGSCRHRGDSGFGSTCYVPAWLGPDRVYKRFISGGYLEANWPELQALVEGRQLRICAYGDGAAVSFEIWTMLLVTAAGFTFYTHQWRTCDPRLKAIAMASVDDEREFYQAGLRGWRTFRVRQEHDPLIAGAEFVCPTSDEGGHRGTCQTCGLCRGQASPARSVAIIAHGHNGVMAAFHRKRPELRA